MKFLKVLITQPGSRGPTKAYPGSAGFDLFTYESGVIPVLSKVVLPCGFATEFDPGFVAQVWDRSSIGLAGLTKLAGVIDADFRGEWKVCLLNLSGKPYPFGPEKAIAQVLFVPVETPQIIMVESLGNSARGEGMNGSSDKKGL